MHPLERLSAQRAVGGRPRLRLRLRGLVRREGGVGEAEAPRPPPRLASDRAGPIAPPAASAGPRGSRRRFAANSHHLGKAGRPRNAVSPADPLGPGPADLRGPS